MALFLAASLPVMSPSEAGEGSQVWLRGSIVDAVTGEPLAARVYLQNAAGDHLFLESGSANGSAFRYDRANWTDATAVEKHTVLSAHPFQTKLTPGSYVLTVEHGKEYFAETRALAIGAEDVAIEIPLRRWSRVADEGWYSGDTHVHGALPELPVTQLAEDLNVALPMLDWATRVETPPTLSRKTVKQAFAAEPIQGGPAHVWYPRNTEYEISVQPDVHTLGAFLILNHRTRFDQAVFPLRAIGGKAHAEGALIDLEKPNWPWTIALVPLVQADLFPLSNNHVWRTHFVARDYAVPAPAWMGLAGRGLATEEEWVRYGFEVYYALLNCGFRLWPSAGSAWGVHPVPLGFSRVYVYLDGPFSYGAWMRGLGEGRSFVTTGPMLLGSVDDEPPGHVFPEERPGRRHVARCRVRSEHPPEWVELVANGQVVQRFAPRHGRNAQGAYEQDFSHEITVNESTWLCWRMFETRPDGRSRFAHTAPWHLPVKDAPLRPRAEQIAWLVQCVEDEIARNESVLPPSVIDEYRESLAVYQRIAIQVASK